MDSTFKVIREFAGKRSEVVFDYVRASALRQTGSHYGESAIATSVSRAGETWQFGIEKRALEPFLKKYGLELSKQHDAQDLDRMYFADSAGKIVVRVNGAHLLVRAV